MEKFNITDAQREQLKEVANPDDDVWEWNTLEYFKSIRPKAYIRLIKRNAHRLGLSGFNNTDEWWHGLEDAGDYLVVNSANEILERCDIENS